MTNRVASDSCLFLSTLTGWAFLSGVSEDKIATVSIGLFIGSMPMNPDDDLRQRRSRHPAVWSKDIAESIDDAPIRTPQRGGVGSTGELAWGFGTIDEAMKAAAVAQRALVALGLETRKRIIAEIRAECHRHVQKMADDEVAETGLGRVDQKLIKNRLVIDKTQAPRFWSHGRNRATMVLPLRNGPPTESSVPSRQRPTRPRPSSAMA